MLELQGSVAEWPKLCSRKELFGSLISNQSQVCREGIVQEAWMGVPMALSRPH